MCYNGVDRDMCMGGAQHIYGGRAHINCTKMILAGEGILRGAKGALPPLKSIKM